MSDHFDLIYGEIFGNLDAPKNSKNSGKIAQNSKQGL